MSVIRRFLGDTMIYGVTTIVSRLINFIPTPLLTYKFAPATYGIYTQLYAFAAMINAVLAFGMETTYFRYLNTVEERDKEKVFNNSFLVTMLTVGCFLFIVFSFSDPIALWLSEGHQTNDYIDFVKLFVLILSADALTVVPFAKLRSQGKAKRFALLKMINIITFVSLTVLFLFWLPNMMAKSQMLTAFASGWFRPDWLGNVFIANLVASVLTLMLLLPEMMGFRLRPDKVLLKKMLYYSLPILIANISFIINEHLDKMMLPKLVSGEGSEDQLGIYGAMAKLAVFLNLFVTAFRLGAEPFFFSYAKNENAKRTYALIMEYFVVAMVIIMVGICANLDWLKHFITAKSPEEQMLYWSGLFIVPLLLFNYVLLGIYMNLTIWYKLSDRTRYAIYISGAGAVVTIVLNFILIPKYSYVGAAICTTIAYLVMLSLSYSWGQKHYPIPYPVMKILSYLLVGIGLSYVVYAVLDAHILWSNALFVLFCVAVVLVEKNKLLRFVSF